MGDNVLSSEGVLMIFKRTHMLTLQVTVFDFLGNDRKRVWGRRLVDWSSLSASLCLIRMQYLDKWILFLRSTLRYRIFSSYKARYEQCEQNPQKSTINYILC